MTISDPALLMVFKEIEVVIDEVVTGSPTESRARKDKRVQLLIIDKEEIYEEIFHADSPFMQPKDRFTAAERRKYAASIEKDLWNIYSTNKTIHRNRYTIGQEADFIDTKKPAMFVDRANKSIYIKGKPKSSHFALVGPINKKVSDLLTNTRKPDDATRMFYSPHPDWLAEYNKLEEGLVKKADELFGEEQSSEKTRWKGKQREGRNQDHKDLNQKYPYNTQGINSGHAFGGGISVASPLVPGKLADIDLTNIKLISSIEANFKVRSREIAVKLFDLVISDGNIKYERKLGAKGPFGEITVLLPQLARTNKIDGTKAKEAFKKLKKKLEELRQDVIKMRGSPSYFNLMREYIESTFTGKQIRSKKYTVNKPIKGKKVKIKAQASILKGSTVTVRKSHSKSGTSKRSTEISDLQNLIVLINSKLTVKIRQNMGKGRSKQVLNWRTGTFGKSAELKELLPSKNTNTLNAIVKYHGAPYDKYTQPTHPLYKPLREPSGIFGRSIRQILQEEKIIKLKRVKVELIDG